MQKGHSKIVKLRFLLVYPNVELLNIICCNFQVFLIAASGQIEKK